MPTPTELQKYIQAHFGVTQEDLAAITGFFEPVILKKGDHFLRAEQHSDQLGFVQVGIVREYLNLGDREVIKWIATNFSKESRNRDA